MKMISAFAGLVLVASMATASPPYQNSVVSNDFAFITPDDPNAFVCVSLVDRGTREMPDKRHDALFADDVSIYRAAFSDGVTTEIWAHPDLGDTSAGYVEKLARAMGHLPTLLRQPLSHVVLLDGNETAFAEDLGRFFTIYSENIDDRISTNDLEETIFHESIHASLDIPLARSHEWLDAQRADGDAITVYAAQNLEREDLAETALFAYTYLATPGRLPARVTAQIEQRIPNRVAVLRDIFAGPRFQSTGPAPAC
jgi:hypothetical protein